MSTRRLVVAALLFVFAFMLLAWPWLTNQPHDYPKSWEVPSTLEPPP